MRWENNGDKEACGWAAEALRLLMKEARRTERVQNYDFPLEKARLA